MREQAAWCHAVAVRDGLTPDQAYVLTMMWAWPWGIAIKPAIDKATDGREDWHAWRQSQDLATLPTVAEWVTATERELVRAD